MEKDIAVIDTCVWLSAFLNKTDKIIRLVAEHQVVIYSCPELQEEISRHLFEDDYFLKQFGHPDKFLRFFNENTLNVFIDQRFDRAADVKDNFLFDLVYTVKSYYIVTSDKPLLNMKQAREIHLISPRDYFRLFGMKW